MTVRTARPIAGRGRSIRGLIAVAVGLLATAACGDPLEPGDVAGNYVLDAVAGEPLPAVLLENPHYRFRVHADELRLNVDGSGHRVTTGIGERLDMEGDPEATTWDRELVFRVVGGRVEIEYVCPINASCTPPPHLIARRVAGGLRVESTQAERDPLWYVPDFVEAYLRNRTR